VIFGRIGNGSRNGKPGQPGRIPRVTRLLALAHRIEGMIRTGKLKDWAEAARLIGITRARMTQIINLLLLAPAIQEVILFLSPTEEGRDNLSENDLRAIVARVNWRQQEKDFSDRSFTQNLDIKSLPSLASPSPSLTDPNEKIFGMFFQRFHKVNRAPL